MHFLTMLIVGFIIGALARLFMPGRQPAGIIITILLGIAGSYIGGLIGRALGWYATPYDTGIIMSVLGAMLILFIYRLILGKRT